MNASIDCCHLPSRNACGPTNRKSCSPDCCRSSKQSAGAPLISHCCPKILSRLDSWYNSQRHQVQSATGSVNTRLSWTNFWIRSQISRLNSGQLLRRRSTENWAMPTVPISNGIWTCSVNFAGVITFVSVLLTLLGCSVCTTCPTHCLRWPKPWWGKR